MFTPPTVKLPENTTRAELKPCRVEMSGLATWLVMVWVSAMLIPWSMKNVPRVTRKDGIPDFTTIQPLMQPISRENPSATSTPPQALGVNHKATSDPHRAELGPATTADG